MTTRASRQTKTIVPVGAGLVFGRRAISYPVKNRVGEAPCWNDSNGVLQWIDVRGQLLLSLDPRSNQVSQWELPEPIGAMCICKSNRVWLALKRSIVQFDTETGVMELVATVEGEKDTNRLNDGKVSPSGNWFVFGSMDDRTVKEQTGALYCASVTGNVRKLFGELTVSNGIAWSPDAKTLYFSDSSSGVLLSSRWNEEKGEMTSTPSVMALLDETKGRPDGAVTDCLGNYWSAGVSAGRINVIHPDGTLVKFSQVPCQAPTMPAFGGSDAGTMYVTSLVRPHWESRGEHDGGLLAFDSPTAGALLPVFKA